MGLKLVISGSRKANDRDVVIAIIENVVRDNGWDVSEVIHGDCDTGVDQFADFWARSNNLPVTKKPADWSLGKKAGPLRNEEMAKIGDMLLAIPHPRDSPGTWDMIRAMRRHKKPLIIYHLPDLS